MLTKKSIPMLTAWLLATSLQAQTLNPEKGEASPAFTPTEGCTAIPDDAYDGTLDSMACVTVPGGALIVTEVVAHLSLNHTWVGDLTIKVRSPAGTVTTLTSRPGLDEPADDGTFCCGDSSDFDAGSSIVFDDDAANDAEELGVYLPAGGVICRDDGYCDYFPSPDTGPGSGLADFAGENGDGDWMICAGDSAGGDLGEICDAGVDVFEPPICLPPCVAPIPTLDDAGLGALLAALGAAGLACLRRRRA